MKGKQQSEVSRKLTGGQNVAQARTSRLKKEHFELQEKTMCSYKELKGSLEWCDKTRSKSWDHKMSMSNVFVAHMQISSSSNASL